VKVGGTPDPLDLPALGEFVRDFGDIRHG
jgi:hypothetical protein